MRMENNTMENNTDKDKNNQARATTEPFTSINNTASTSGTVKENATELSHDKSGLTFGQHTTTKNFEKAVLKELYLLGLKIDDISETLNVVLKNKADELQKASICNEVPDILQSFPVDDNSLAQLENWLNSSEENKTILAQNLSRIGGCNVKEVVRRIMYRVFTNEVGMCFSWEGAKKKKAFKNLAIAPIILSAVRLNKNTRECTDSEIICFIKAWLVRSKDRFNNNNKAEATAPLRDETVQEATY